ncbi:MAG: acetolactate synthase small subunit [Clostridiaceae bacterium]|jgi:acetolactate synthase-1/3 small subunit|nr:acetolactate synthase small subunit [Clostridiaceae bacterium]
MGTKKFTLIMLVENKHGVLNRISGLFAKRAYNIDNLSVGATHNPKVSRMTIVVECEEPLLEQIIEQLKKLVDVIAVEVTTSALAVMRELMLIKISHNDGNFTKLTGVINDIFRGRVVDITQDSVIAEITGPEDKLNAFIKFAEPMGIIELARTGVTALNRGSRALVDAGKD